LILPFLIVPIVIGVGVIEAQTVRASVLSPIDVCFAAFIVAAADTAFSIGVKPRWLMIDALLWSIVSLVVTAGLLAAVTFVYFSIQINVQLESIGRPFVAEWIGAISSAIFSIVTSLKIYSMSKAYVRARAGGIPVSGQ
jgi:hypothetical protein